MSAENQETKGQKLRKLREEKGFTLQEVGDLVGESKQTIHKYERDIITNIPSSNVEKLAKLFSVSPSYIMGWFAPTVSSVTPEHAKDYAEGKVGIHDHAKKSGLHNEIKMIDIPIIGSVAAGEAIERIEHIEGYQPTDISRIPGGDENSAFWLKVKGNSMTGDGIEEGDLVLVHKTTEVHSHEIACVAVNDFEATIKRVNCENDMCVLRPSNKDHDVQIHPAEKIHIIGKVIGLQKFF